jgi:proteasome lid subunit RPN8/RPN11
MTTDQRDELFAHALEDSPNECCGYLRIRDGAVEDVHRSSNDQPSRMYGYMLDAKSLLGAYNAVEDGYDVGIYHSHPRSPAEPSQTDINLADYPEYVYLIVSLADHEPAVRAWWIAEGKVSEEEIEFT